MQSKNNQIAYLAGGCFWCIEAVYIKIKGIKLIQSGYMGGDSKNPTYKEVCSGKSGHAEVIKIEYNNEQITYEQILEIFFKAHDPTTLNRQGNDVGSQYRSAIFYLDFEQQSIAKSFIEKIKLNFKNKIVTEITKAKEFYLAEEYHQNYFYRNPNQPYCMFIIREKLKKLNLHDGI